MWQRSPRRMFNRCQERVLQNYDLVIESFEALYCLTFLSWTILEYRSLCIFGDVAQSSKSDCKVRWRPVSTQSNISVQLCRWGAENGLSIISLRYLFGIFTEHKHENQQVWNMVHKGFQSTAHISSGQHRDYEWCYVLQYYLGLMIMHCLQSLIPWPVISIRHAVQSDPLFWWAKLDN